MERLHQVDLAPGRRPGRCRAWFRANDELYVELREGRATAVSSIWTHSSRVVSRNASSTRPERISCSGWGTRSRAADPRPRSTRPAGPLSRSDVPARGPRDARLPSAGGRDRNLGQRRRLRWVDVIGTLGSARRGFGVRPLRRLGRRRGLGGRDVGRDGARRTRPPSTRRPGCRRVPPASSGPAHWRPSTRRWSRRSSSSGMWQLIRWPGSTSTSGGSVTSHTPRITRGQRVLKTQPLGGLAGLGISPSSRIRRRSSPSTFGTADSSASVYGWFGPLKTGSESPTSMIRPRYMTAIRSAR